MTALEHRFVRWYLFALCGAAVMLAVVPLLPWPMLWRTAQGITRDPLVLVGSVVLGVALLAMAALCLAGVICLSASLRAWDDNREDES